MKRPALPVLLLWLASCGADAGPSAVPVTAAEPVRPAMRVVEQDLAGDWHDAADVLMQHWRPTLEARAAVATVRAFSSPGGERLPYLFEVETTRADGTPDFRGAALVWDGQLLNNAGSPAAQRWLHDLGFPRQHLPLGHVVQGLYLTGALPTGWARPPASFGWPAFTASDNRLGGPPVSLAYDKRGATLTCLRVGAGVQDDAYMPPTVERLVVHFDAGAALTVDAARKDSSTSGWVAFTP